MKLTDEDKKLVEECGFFIGTNISGVNLVVIMNDGFSAHIKDTELALLLHKVRDAERERCAKLCEAMIAPVDEAWRNKRPDEAAEFDASDAGKQACADAMRELL